MQPPSNMSNLVISPF